jgi:hypothetical protein
VRRRRLLLFDRFRLVAGARATSAGVGSSSTSTSRRESGDHAKSLTPARLRALHCLAAFAEERPHLILLRLAAAARKRDSDRPGSSGRRRRARRIRHRDRLVVAARGRHPDLRRRVVVLEIHRRDGVGDPASVGAQLRVVDFVQAEDVVDLHSRRAAVVSAAIATAPRPRGRKRRARRGAGASR